MKRNLSIIIASALALGTSSVFAEDLQSSQTGQATQPPQIQQHMKQQHLLDSSALENTKVTDKQGQNLGKIERLLFDAASGQLRFAVIQVDKEWSLNNPEVIVPFKVLNISKQSHKDYTVMVETDRTKLEQAPRFNEGLIDQLATRAAGEPIYTHWGLTWSDSPMMSENSSRTESSSTRTELSTSSPSVTSPSSTVTTPTERSSTGSTVGTSESTTSPATTTDGSTSDRSIGTTGTSDTNLNNADKSDIKSPSVDESSSDSLKPKDSSDSNESTESNQPDRTLGGDLTD